MASLESAEKVKDKGERRQATSNYCSDSPRRFEWLNARAERERERAGDAPPSVKATAPR